MPWAPSSRKGTPVCSMAAVSTTWPFSHDTCEVATSRVLGVTAPALVQPDQRVEVLPSGTASLELLPDAVARRCGRHARNRPVRAGVQIGHAVEHGEGGAELDRVH